MQTILTIIGIILILLSFKYDVNIKKEWDCLNITWCEMYRDIYSGEYHKIYYSKTIYKFKKR